MNILMLAPEPYFQPRGTPISVFFRLRALSDLGHRVTLITYPLGENRLFPGTVIVRIPNIFGLSSIKIGPSFIKVPLDVLLLARAFGRLVRSRYDLIFSHEEASLLGVWLSQIWRLPHLYDMHSSLPQQLENFQFSRSSFLRSLFCRMEDYVLRHSRSVIVICRDLARHVAERGVGDRAILLENFLDFECPPFTQEKMERKRKELAPAGEKIVLYAGNFQPYQGIPLLLEAAAHISGPVVFALVGGSREEIRDMQRKAREGGVEKKTVFVERVPPAEVPLFIAASDVLVSPRLSGTNTPLKIYSYLKSGKPLVATNLWTHTQVVDEKTAILVSPDARSLAEGLRFALFDPRAQERAREAQALAEKKYTYDAYVSKIREALDKAVEKKAGKA